MNNASRPSFGFGNLADIEPGPRQPEPAVAARAVDQAAERLGFTSREPPLRRRKRVIADEPTDQINVRAAISDINRFVEWCERERFSYREGFAELVKRIG